MKLALAMSITVALLGPALGEPNPKMSKIRVADSADAACFANCASQNASCKRVCPATFSTPCLSACESQYQSCSRGCQSIVTDAPVKRFEQNDTDPRCRIARTQMCSTQCENRNLVHCDRVSLAAGRRSGVPWQVCDRC